MKRKITLALVAALAAGIAFAQEEEPVASAEPVATSEPVANEQLNDMISEASIPADTGREASIEERMTKWRDGQIWQNGQWVPDPLPVTGKMIEEQVRNSGGMIVQGTGIIGVPPTDPNFGKLRTLAYERALNEARARYLVNKKDSNTAAVYSEVSGIGGDAELKYVHELPKSQEEEILRKTMALTGAKLDRALEELGVDKKKYSQAEPPQRVVELRDAVGRKILDKSFGELSGLMPIQTFEGYQYEEGEKVQYVGVICTVTESSRQLAKDILTLRGDFPTPKKKGFALEPYYRSIEDKLPDMFGIRRMKDAEGYPVLVAFGQWSRSKQTGNAILASRYADLARKQSESWARSELGLFLNGNFEYENPSEMGAEFEKAYNVFADDSVQAADMQTVMDSLSSKLTGKSHVTISGVRVLHQWSRPHPDYPNVMLYGTVVAWSPVYEKTARALDKPLAPTRPGVPERISAPENVPGPASRQSAMDMDLDDF